ncbi:MAG: hypothetical protein U1F14_04100 [Steroidobacteraceae bacterium]
MPDEYKTPFGYWDVDDVAVVIRRTADRGATIDEVREDGTLRPFALGTVYRRGQHISRLEFVRRFPFAALIAL